jgi:hypothetical protein
MTNLTSKLTYCEILSYHQTIKTLLPDVPSQHDTTLRIEKEQKLVDANRQLIARYEQKIKEQIDILWSKEV